MAFGWYFVFFLTTLVVDFNILLKIVSKYSFHAFHFSITVSLLSCVSFVSLWQHLSPWVLFTLSNAEIADFVAVAAVVVAVATVADEAVVDVAADRLHLAVCEISCGRCDFLPY